MKEICAYIQPFMLPWVKRIEIFAPDELVKIIFDTLIQAANTHHSDAGKIYLIEVSKSGEDK